MTPVEHGYMYLLSLFCMQETSQFVNVFDIDNQVAEEDADEPSLQLRDLFEASQISAQMANYRLQSSAAELVIFTRLLIMG